MKLSLPTKIFLAFGITVLVFASLAVYSLRSFRNVGEDLQNIVSGHLVLARLTGQLETHQQNRFRDVRRAIAADSQSNRQAILRISNAYHPQMIFRRIEDTSKLCRKQLFHLKSTTRKSVPKDFERESKRDFYLTVLRQIEQIQEKHIQLSQELESLNGAVTNSTTARARTASKVGTIEAELVAVVYQLTKSINEQTERAVYRAQQNEKTTAWRIVAITAIALLLGVLLALWSTRALAPIQELVEFAKAISRGDYERKVHIRGDDELSTLGNELMLMARGRQKREEELDRQQDELERAYHRVADLKKYHESVVESLSTSIIVTDRDLLITSANEAVFTNFGMSESRVIGKYLPDLDLGAVMEKESQSLKSILENNELQNISSFVYQERLYEAAIVPFRSAEGVVLGLVIAAEDVTVAVQTKEALIRSERLAAIGRMSAHVTHEIRNPLSSIGLNAEILESLKPEDAKQTHELCQAIIREVDRLTAITEAYLNFARLPRPNLRNASPKRLLEDIAAFVGPECTAAGVNLIIQAEDAEISLDIDQIRQAILNLVRNAKESMPSGGALHLLAEPVNHEFRIRIQDNGVGIEETEISRIFDPFYSTKQTGTGLGLALVQQIVSEHNARLEAASVPGEGTRFDLYFPLREISEQHA
ncbi:MAG: ATP-binding protein [Myxococcota bacterium]|nr:ATP-binding protein [Myxococcota bacterium]